MWAYILWTLSGNYQIFSNISRVFVIKFYVELGENGKETLQLLQEVCVPEAMGRHTVFRLWRHLLAAWEMEEEGICFSPCSLKLTAVVQWHLSLVSVLAREDVGVHLHAPQTKTEPFWLRVLTNSRLDKLSGKNFWTRGYTWSLAVIWPLQQNTKILLPKSLQICLHISHLEPGIQNYRLPRVFCKHKPGLMLGTMWRTTHVTLLHISNHQASRFYDHHNRFFVC